MQGNCNLKYFIRSIVNSLLCRLVLSSENSHQVLKDMIHPSQLESRYGGEAENLTSYWPPQYRSNEFGHNPDLINWSQSEYLIEEKEEIKFEMIPQTKEGIFK